MNREQMEAHLILNGWWPCASKAANYMWAKEGRNAVGWSNKVGVVFECEPWVTKHLYPTDGLTLPYRQFKQIYDRIEREGF